MARVWGTGSGTRSLAGSLVRSQGAWPPSTAAKPTGVRQVFGERRRCAIESARQRPRGARAPASSKKAPLDLTLVCRTDKRRPCSNSLLTTKPDAPRSLQPNPRRTGQSDDWKRQARCQCPLNTSVWNGSTNACRRRIRACTSPRASTTWRAMPFRVPVSFDAIRSWLLE